MHDLTPRQREVKALLDQGLSARQIAEKLGITRNAVYQQIQRLRHYGALAKDFTASGLPTREQQPEAGQAGVVALAQELHYVRDELDRISRRLSAIL